MALRTSFALITATTLRINGENFTEIAVYSTALDPEFLRALALDARLNMLARQLQVLSSQNRAEQQLLGRAGRQDNGRVYLIDETDSKIEPEPVKQEATTSIPRALLSHNPASFTQQLAQEMMRERIKNGVPGAQTDWDKQYGLIPVGPRR
jgi:hypothetical protein